LQFIMSDLPAAVDNQNEGGASGIGDDDGGVMNEGDVDYIERQEESHVEISDYQGNVFTVSFDDLASVGVDISRQQIEISPEQWNELLLSMAPIDEGIPAGSEKMDEYEEVHTGDQLIISIHGDGDIKLMSAAGGPASYFSSSQLAEVNIDTANLTDEDIKRIVQLAGAASGQFNYDDRPQPDKRRKLDSGVEEQRMLRNYQSQPSHSAASTSSGLAPGPSNNPGRRPIPIGRPLPIQNGLIGESVKIHNAKGKVVTAVVRYCRPGSYKVQTADGKFEWVATDRIIDRAPRLEIREYDHKGYTTEPSPPVSNMTTMPSTSSGGGALMLSRRVFASSGGGGGVQQLLQRPLPLIRQLPPSLLALHHHVHHPQQPAPNFCCPVCDRKVYQKEPAYIVIRLPACDGCTREKILIVDSDDSTPSGAGGGGGGPSSSTRPTMRSIATDTDDLPSKEEEKTSEEDPSTTSPEESPAAADDEHTEKSVEEEEEERIEQPRYSTPPPLP
ncbi:hypothetical protein PENTCL1PPCAC_4433, partial [Pristionchus entomophagus]